MDLSSGLNKNDYKIIEEDWNQIKEMVLKGKAHLISEKQTKILGACTKSSTNKIRRMQPNNIIKAKPRAFSIKSSFITKIVREKSISKIDANFITSK